MKVFYHRSATPNVGDDLNATLWSRLLPRLDAIATADWLIGIGTILDERINRLQGRKVVIGAGLRPAAVLPRFTGEVCFAAVRGEQSARLLDLPARAAVCDPGFLIGKAYPNLARSASTRVGFVPHVYSERWSGITHAAGAAGFHVISPSLPIDEFLERLCRCDRIYTESLHGAIFADALRIPWARMHICSRYYEGAGVADFKWRDAFSLLGVDTAPSNHLGLASTGSRPWWSARPELRPVQAALERRLVHALSRRQDDGALFRLSPASRLEERCDRLLQLVTQLESEAAIGRWPRPSSQRAVRVLAFPRHTENPYVQSLFSHVAEAGAVVDEFTFARARSGRYDVVHVQWPELHLRARSAPRLLAKHARFALTCAMARLRGAHIVWTLHNLQPHEHTSAFARVLFRAWFPRLCTHVIALTAQGLYAAQRAYPALLRKQDAVIPHGHYRDAYGRPPSRSDARSRLGLPQEAFVYLFFGGIRPYKNVPGLLQAFDRLSEPNAHLLVAGRPSEGVTARALRERTGNPRVHWHLGFIPAADVPTYLSAADAIVLPFHSIQNSGSVLLALSFDRAVLAPRQGALPEIQRQVGTRWLTLYDGTLQASDLAAMAHEVPPEATHTDLSAFAWPDIARRTLELYTRPRRAPLERSAGTETAGAERAP